MAVASEELPVFAAGWEDDAGHGLGHGPLAGDRAGADGVADPFAGVPGRANHYVGALWFYELHQPGQQYASATVTFTGTPEFSRYTYLRLGETMLAHLNLVGDTAESIAKAFELEINAGSTGVWARAEGAVLTIYARRMGTAGNGLAIVASTDSTVFTAEVSGPTAGGLDGGCRLSLEPLPDAAWATDMEAVPRINRAARDWSRSFYMALEGYGIDAAAAFSMELRHGDPDTAAGVAQRYPDGSPAWLNTPALQTNFSPTVTAFWKQVYAEMAAIMVEAGQRPFLQFGEVQWWYFPAPSGMPFYDDYTKSAFQAAHGRPMHVFTTNQEQPDAYPQECEFLRGLIGQFTTAVMAFVRQEYGDARFEVLYPPDVNDTPLNRVVNLPAEWTPATLDCFKTENFTFTGDRNLDKARESLRLPLDLGFPRSRSSHLVGVWEYTTPWAKECLLAKGEGLESVVLFALDQYCLLGHAAPRRTIRRSLLMSA